MADQSQPVALDRIERAMSRIAAATAASAAAHDTLQRRHATLRAQVGEAIAALDVLLDPA